MSAPASHNPLLCRPFYSSSSFDTNKPPLQNRVLGPMARLSALVPWLHSTDRDPEVASTGSLLAPLFHFPSHSPCCSISIPIVLLTFSLLSSSTCPTSRLSPPFPLPSNSFQLFLLSSTRSLLSRPTGIRRMAGSTTRTAVEATQSRTISRTKCEVVQHAEAGWKR